MNMTLLIAVGGAVLFYRAAQYERMSPWLWTVASLGLTLGLGAVGSGTVTLIVGQLLLFAVMWAYNAFRKPG